MFKFTSDIINKKPKITKVFLKKSLKLNSSYRDYFAILLLILDLLEANYFLKKQNSKKNLAKSYSLGSIEIIFIPLAKMIVIYIKFLKI